MERFQTLDDCNNKKNRKEHLKQIAKEMGLPVYGTKEQICNRIFDYYNISSSQRATPKKK